MRYQSVIVYEAVATCESPFRCGNAENDMERVLQDDLGSFFLPGTSLAGSFREYAEKKGESALFGSTEEESALVFSDGLFQKDSKLVLRPRIAINHSTGTVVKNGKFDMAHLETGSVFHFRLTWLGEEEERVQASDFLKEGLSALHHGEITLGGQKNNGFGRVSLEVKEKHFRLSREKERAEWLGDTWTARPMTLLPSEKKGLSIQIQGKMDNLLIKDKVVDKVMTQMREAGTPIIPSSSLRGVLRHRVQSIADFLEVEENFLALLFGSSDHKGAISFEEITLNQAKSTKIARIHINKFTGGVLPQAIFTEESHASSINWEIKLAEDFPQKKQAISLLLFALRDMAFGLVPLGSGASLGRGVVDISSVMVQEKGKNLGGFTINQNKELEIQGEKDLFQPWEGVS